MSSTRICLVRHGETDWNVLRRIQGQEDVPLNAVGRAQARTAAAALAGQRFAAVYSSDLGRAWQTADMLAQRLGLTVRTEPDLRERHFGVMQGLTADECAQLHPDIHARHRARDPDCRLDTGESLREFAERVRAVVERLAARHRGGQALVVSHGGVLDACYRQATGRELTAPRDFPIPNAAFNWIEIDCRSWRLLAWADRSHLERALEEPVE